MGSAPTIGAGIKSMSIKTNRTDVDSLGNYLSYLGQWGKNLPHSWEGGRCSIPILSPDGGYFGRVLPGKGVLIDSDLKYAGVYKKIPYVYEKSLVFRLYEKFKDDRLCISLAGALLSGLTGAPAIAAMAVSKYDDILSSLALGQWADWETLKANLSTATSQWSTLSSTTGIPGAVTYTGIPGGAALDNTTAGSWGIGIQNVPSGKKCYLIQLGTQSAGQGIQLQLLVDILVAAGTINANLNTSQTVNSTALTRNTGGSGVMMTFEVTTALGATPANITVTYTNQAGTGSQVTAATALTASAIVRRLQPVSVTAPMFALQAGDYGVRSVQSVILSAAMGSGVLALNLFDSICIIPPVSSSQYIERDIPGSIDGLIELLQTSGGNVGFLSIYVLPNTTSTGGVLDWHFKTVIN